MSATKWMTITPFLKQCLITMGMSLNNVLHGCALGYPAALLPQLRASTMKISRDEESWIASVVALAMFAGTLLTLPAMRCGRKLTSHLVSLLNIAGWLAAALAPNYQVLMIGRFFQGMSFGLLFPIIGVILGEYTSPAYRGLFLAGISLGQSTGIFIIHVIGSYMAWRDTALLLSFFPLISFTITIFTPESPSWLAVAGRYDECRKSFRWLRGPDEEEELDKMIRARQHFDRQAKIGGNSVRDTVIGFSKREFVIPIILGSFMYIVSLNSGSLILASYIVEMLHTLIGEECQIYAWIVVCDGIRLVTNCIAVYVVSKLQRRQMLFWGGTISVSLYFTQAAYIFAKDFSLVDYIWLPGTLLILHVATIGSVMMVVPFVIIGEIYPLQYRNVCSFINSMFLGGGVFVVLKTFPGLCGSIGLKGAYLVYGGSQLIALVVIWFLLPETCGKTLQEIEEQFRRKPVVPDDEALVSLNDVKIGPK